MNVLFLKSLIKYRIPVQECASANTRRFAKKIDDDHQFTHVLDSSYGHLIPRSDLKMSPSRRRISVQLKGDCVFVRSR